MAIAPDSKQPTSHTDSRGNAVVVKAPPAPVIKTQTNGGVLGGAHMGGHSDVAKAKAAEQMLRKDMAAGKVKNLDAERTMIFKKTGGYANGYTN